MDTPKNIDPMYQRAMEFFKNFKMKNKFASISNLYVLQTVDRDGNVTCERYGLNIMTNYGMTQYFTSNGTFPTNVYIGNGSGSITYTNNSLNSPIVTTASTLASAVKSYDYPLYYDSITGTITTQMKYCEVYFNYTLTDITGPVDVSEYGIGSAWNQLWTHSWVYNSIGQRSTITKNVNERLYITVFMCMSYPLSVITDALESNKFICITNQARFFNRISQVAMAETKTYTYKRKTYYDRPKTHTISSFVDNKYEITTNMSSFVLTEAEEASNSYIDGFISWSDGFSMFDRTQLANPESFDLVGKPLATHFDKITGFSESFGVEGCGIPFTQADITASYTYHRSTGQYSCPDHFLNNANKWYNELPFNLTFKTKLLYTNNNEFQTVYLYRNLNPVDPIVAINGATTTLYATDSYWDTSSWVRISDMDNVPQSVQNAKYWLSGHSDIALEPVRGLQSFEFIGSDGTTRGRNITFNQSLIPQGSAFTSADMVNHDWFTIGGNVYVISRNTAVTPANCSRAIGYDKNILSFGAGSNFALTNLSRVVLEPTGEIIANTASIGNLSETHISESNTGYVIFKSEGNNSNCVKVDLTGQNGIVQTQLQNTTEACCIANNGTYYAVIESSNTRRVVIRKLSDDSEYKSFSVPSNYTAPNFIFGFNKYVYATDGSSYGYVFDITGESATAIETTGFVSSIGTSARYSRFAYLDDMIIIYNRTAASLGWAYVIEASSPSTITRLEGLTHGGTYFGNIQLNLFKINGNTYILEKDSRYNGTYQISHYSIDLGKYLNEGVVEGFERNTPYQYNFIKFDDEFMLAGTTLFHVGNLVPHRLVGTTSCVSTHYRRKAISNKSWMLEITNIASYDGKPPGSRQ